MGEGSSGTSSSMHAPQIKCRQGFDALNSQVVRTDGNGPEHSRYSSESKGSNGCRMISVCCIRSRFRTSDVLLEQIAQIARQSAGGSVKQSFFKYIVYEIYRKRSTEFVKPDSVCRIPPKPVHEGGGKIEYTGHAKAVRFLPEKWGRPLVRARSRRALSRGRGCASKKTCCFFTRKLSSFWQNRG